MKTIKDQAASAASGLGCKPQDVSVVLDALADTAFPLTARSMVLQVATAMKSVGLEPKMDRVEAVASRL